MGSISVGKNFFKRISRGKIAKNILKLPETGSGKRFHALKMVAINSLHKITPRKSFKKIFSNQDPASICTPFKAILGVYRGVCRILIFLDEFF
jgi:hypothetical protein